MGRAQDRLASLQSRYQSNHTSGPEENGTTEMSMNYRRAGYGPDDAASNVGMSLDSSEKYFNGRDSHLTPILHRAAPVRKSDNSIRPIRPASGTNQSLLKRSNQLDISTPASSVVHMPTSPIEKSVNQCDYMRPYSGSKVRLNGNSETNELANARQRFEQLEKPPANLIFSKPAALTGKSMNQGSAPYFNQFNLQQIVEPPKPTQDNSRMNGQITMQQSVNQVNMHQIMEEIKLLRDHIGSVICEQKLQRNRMDEIIMEQRLQRAMIEDLTFFSYPRGD